MIEITAIFMCILGSAFFSSAESAITSLGTLKARHLQAKKRHEDPYLRFWLNQPQHILTTALVFHTAVNILAASLATHYTEAYFGHWVLGIAGGLITAFVLILGEVVCKAYAKAHAERLALIALRILIPLSYAIYPIVRSLSLLAEHMEKPKGRNAAPAIPFFTEEELQFIIEEGQKAGIIGEMKTNIITGAFEFEETRVREIMTPRPDIKGVPYDASLTRMIDKAVETGYSRLPVYKRHMDQIIGVVLVKDLLEHRTEKDKVHITAQDIMREAIYVPESQLISDVFKDLKRNKSHIVIAIDEYGGTAGLVTMEDILEEFVGEIQDEFDIEPAKIVEVNKDVFEVSGSTNLDDFLDHFAITSAAEDTDEDVEDVDTVAGFVTQLVGQMPKVGQKTEFGGLQFEVTKVKQHRIQTVKVERLEKSSEA
jgi:putative hemolysin